ncbi:MAG: transporter [Gemmatimonadetes bacterium]|nr:transporter [Gemmatimonadota bacterium]
MLPYLLGAGAALLVERFAAKLREDSTEARGVADVLPYGFLVAPGVVLNKDGSLLAGFRFRGPDSAAATAEDLADLSEYIAGAFSPVGDGWGFHVSEARRESVAYPRAAGFPDSVSALVDEERRRSYESAGVHYESDFYLVATYLPPSDRYSKLVAFFVEGAARGDLDWQGILAQYEGELAELRDRLRGRLHMERLDDAALLGHLHACLTGLHHAVRVPEDGAYLNVVLSDQDFTGGWEPRIGDKHVRVVAVQDFPWRPEPAALEALGRMPFGFRWCSRFVLLSAQAGEAEIKKARRGWRAQDGLRQLLGGARNSARNDAAEGGGRPLSMDADAEAALALSESGQYRFLAYTATLVLYEDDAGRADANARELLRVLNDLGFTGRVESVNAVDAFWGSLPGLFYPNLRRPVLHTGNLGQLFPSTALWAGEEHNPSPLLPPSSPPLMIAETAGSTPFRLNTDTDTSGNVLVLGPPGAGKSAFLNLHRLQVLRYAGAQTAFFDIGHSAWLPAVATGARHYDIGGDGGTLQPLRNVDQNAEALWGREWVEGLIEVQGHACDAGDRVKLERAVRLLGKQPPRNRTLTELHVQLQDAGLRAALEPYLGTFLDGDADSIEDAPHLVFEMGALMKMGRTLRTPTVLYLLHRVELMTAAGARPTWTYLDEMHRYLDDPVFERWIRFALVTERKNNSRFVLATQSLAQLEVSAARHIVYETCRVKILLPNPEAATTSRALYTEIGLNEAEIRHVATATPSRDYFVRSPAGKRVFSLGIGPVGAAFLFPRPGLSTQDTRRLASAMMADHGPQWTREWLRLAGLSGWADALRSTIQTQENGDAHSASSLDLALA